MQHNAPQDSTESIPHEDGIGCSECGHDSFERTAPKALVAFAPDYHCRRCGHGFPATAPIWASLLFLPGGSLLTAAGLTSLRAGANDRNSIAQLPGMGMLFMGTTAAGRGGRSLLQIRMTVEIED